MIKVTHPTQTRILRALILENSLTYSELNKGAAPEMSSDNFNFHLQKLIKLGVIEKKGDKYSISDRGLEFASRIDILDSKIFKQPKLSIALGIFENQGDNKILLAKRKYQPLKGYWGFHTEKVRFGEKWEDTITRCLKKETGLSMDRSQNFGVTHLIRTEKKQIIADVIHILFKIYPKDKNALMNETEEIINEWVPVKNVLTDYQTTKSFKLTFEKMINGEMILEETLVKGRK